MIKRRIIVSHSLIYIVSILFILTSGNLKADSNYYFKQLSTDQGLSQTMVRCILCDNNGLTWIGTKMGLNSFDQYELKNYFHEAENPHSLPSNLIHFIAEDSLLNIWVATEKGLSLYNRTNDQFIPVTFNEKPLITYSFLLTNKGILFGGDKKIYFYSYQNRTFTQLPLFTKVVNEPQFNKIYSIGKNTLLVGSRYEGLFLYHTDTHVLEKHPYIKEVNISSVYADSNNQIWISPYYKGIVCYNNQGEIVNQFNTNNSELSNNIVLDMVKRDNQLWIATDGGGINILDIRTQRFTIIEHHPGDNYSLPSNSIYCLYEDRESNMWAGCIRGGALGIKETYIRTYKDVPLQNTYGLSEKTVISLHEDASNTLWIGTDGGGLNSYNPLTSKFTHHLSTYPEKIVSIESYNKNQLLLSFYNKGFFLFDKATGILSPFILVDEKTNVSECAGGISVLCMRTQKDKLMFLGNRIYFYDEKEKKFGTTDSNIEEQRLLQFIETKGACTYLIGLSGISRFNHNSNKLEKLFAVKNGVAPLTACLDRENRIWVGTDLGLTCFNLQTRKQHTIQTTLFKNVSSLTSDSQGNLWIGAQNMLFYYIVNENSFILLGESDGVYPNELMHNPKMASSHNIYIGGASGLVCIDKHISFGNYSQPQVKLMDIIVDGTSKIGLIDDKLDAVITVPWDHSSVVIKIIAKEKDIFRKKVFRYIVLGRDKKQIESYSHTLNLNTLSQGEYTIMASCSSQSGIWSLPIKILSISVIPPWWKSSWFIACCLLAGLLTVIFTARTFAQKHRNKLKWQMKEYEKKIYEEKIRFLINISHELRTPLTLIYGPLKRMIDGKFEGADLSRQLLGVYKQSKQMRNIINMVLDVRKMEVGQDTLHIQPHPMNEWLQTIANDFNNEFQSKNIKLLYHFDEAIEELFFDQSKCEIIVSNLLMNALKFSEPHTTVELSTLLMPDKEMVRVSVSDQGIGLQGVDTTKLFTRFYQGNHDRSGTGIGLSYAKMLVEMHNGCIGAFSNQEQGATFYFELPLSSVAKGISCETKPSLNELLYSSEQEMTESADLSTTIYSIVVIEDEPELRIFLKEALQDFFKKIYLAKDGEEGCNIVYQYQPDIIVSDVMMPKMNGYELCKRIKEDIEVSHIPIILLTARSDMESMSIGYKLGADSYLPKPFDIDLLMTIIHNLLKNREQIRCKYKNKSNLTIHPKEITFSNVDEQFLLKFNSLIQENLTDQKLDVKFLIDKMAMSRASLYNKVKVLTGMGVNDYISRFRIEKAVHLLAETDLSITEISELVGFAYQRYFSEVFKTMKGMSPSKYRQDCKRNAGG